jgi:hypothetical protein
LLLGFEEALTIGVEDGDVAEKYLKTERFQKSTI